MFDGNGSVFCNVNNCSAAYRKKKINIFFFDNRNRFFCNFYFCTYDTGEIVIFKTCVGQRSDYTVVQFVLKIKPRAIAVSYTHLVLPETIAAVSFSGQGGGNFLVSKDGKAIYPGVLSLDNRHEEVLDKIENPERIDIPRTISFMRWLKENEPDVFERTGWILGSKDWLRFCMTGKANADMSDTPAPVDYEHRKYLTETLEVAGVPECESMLPELCYACLLYTSQIALNWSTQKDYVTSALCGVRNVKEATENCKCTEWELTKEEMAMLDKAIEDNLG